MAAYRMDCIGGYGRGCKNPELIIPDAGMPSMSNHSDGEVVSPLPFVHRQQPAHQHVVQFYSQDEFLLEELSRFIGTALGGGNSAIVIATKAHRDGLSQRLHARGLDTMTAIQQARYVPMDAAETLSKFMVNDFPDATRFHGLLGELIAKATAAAEGQHPQVVAFGEMVALLWAEGKGQAGLRLEQLWNELAHKCAFSLHCAYPLSSFYQADHAEPLLKICGEHSAVIPEESYTGLASEEERGRAITQLQQKAQALETEMGERLRIQRALLDSQAALQKSNDELERRVDERTRELVETQGLLRQLSSSLLNLRDEERRRLARELHDSTGQILTALQMNLAMTLQGNGNVDPQEKSNRLLDAMHLADQAIKEVRTLSYLLHPPMLDEAGLLLALEWYVQGLAERSEIEVDLDLPPALDRLPPDLELAIFRIVQEALTNVHRHSGSKVAKVRVAREGERIDITIEDAGKGLTKEMLQVGFARSGVGIRGMQERARQFSGQVRLSNANPGTRVHVTLPVPKNTLKSKVGSLVETELHS
jgi:signal transduction histidine kinase